MSQMVWNGVSVPSKATSLYGNLFLSFFDAHTNMFKDTCAYILYVHIDSFSNTGSYCISQ